MIHLRNLFLFVAYALWHGTPPYLWSQAWEDIQADHLARTRKIIWELKKQGKIYEDRDGRLWPKK